MDCHLVAPLPPTEKSRLAALRAVSVLDTLPEAFSESVAVAAAAIANTPMSAISLVDKSRQWFKASCGMPISETPRQISFCAHAILQSDPLVVADTRLDPRFAGNPMVTGAPHIRFYAGFPLFLDGHAVGSLCVIDDLPRQLSRDTLDKLMQLAASTSVWLSRRP